eukprot:TRINITY_DN20532_c0_g2_i1.p1 TRINITY_DN20532_c0_g2~~TRINITY_DN20532_c0_g2_i1.p1  ORF type:complete len:538 (+),score=41.51 TRINITY_DN20532_c0_g2_i1:39-1616(+)
MPRQDVLQLLQQYPPQSLLSPSGTQPGANLVSLYDQVLQILALAPDNSQTLTQKYSWLFYILWEQGCGFYIVNFVRQVCVMVHSRWQINDLDYLLRGETLVDFCLQAQNKVQEIVQDLHNNDYQEDSLNLWYLNTFQFKRILEILVQLGVEVDNILERINDQVIQLQFLCWVKKSGLETRFQHESLQEWQKKLTNRIERAQQSGFTTMLMDMLKGLSSVGINAPYPTTNLKSIIFDVFQTGIQEQIQQLCVPNLQYQLFAYYLMDAFQDGLTLINNYRREFRLPQWVTEVGCMGYLLDTYWDDASSQKLRDVYCTVQNMKNPGDALCCVSENSNNTVRALPVSVRIAKYMTDLQQAKIGMDILSSAISMKDSGKFSCQDIEIAVKIAYAAKQIQNILQFIRFCVRDVCESDSQGIRQQEQREQMLNQVLTVMVDCCLSDRDMLVQSAELDFQMGEEQLFLNTLLQKGKNERGIREVVVIYFLKRQRIAEARKQYQEVFNSEQCFYSQGQTQLDQLIQQILQSFAY